ncbi:MAG: hypothetical protein KBE04_07050 [Phycisphaerae bacterium]|nr:hypothetical protein [Phycisphaerae bacterium]
MKNSPEEIGRQDGQYHPAAYAFVFEGLGYTVKKAAESPKRHVSGQVLCQGLLQLALERWGLLAMRVLDYWGIHTTRDFGEIVYTLIRYECMSAQPSDTIDDFNDVYDFQTAFKDRFEF